MFNWFTNLSLTWKIIIVIVIIIILWLLWRKFGYKLTQLSQARIINPLPYESGELTPQKEDDLKVLAEGLYNDIEDTSWTGHNYDPYIESLRLTDKELTFLAAYYKKYLGNGESLYKAIDSQLYPTGNQPAKLMARLAAIGRR